jgi:catechol 2,3-dioxygenase-like lactoylglutathione lyase family enzyme
MAGRTCMKVEALDHVNIITDDLDGTARFYEE